MNRTLMFLARYGNQDAIELDHAPMSLLLAWVDRLAELLEDEQRATEDATRRR